MPRQVTTTSNQPTLLHRRDATTSVMLPPAPYVLPQMPKARLQTPPSKHMSLAFNQRICVGRRIGWWLLRLCYGWKGCVLTALWNVPCGMSCVVAALVDVEVMWRALGNGGVLRLFGCNAPSKGCFSVMGPCRTPKQHKATHPNTLFRFFGGPSRLNKATTFQTRPNPEQAPEHPLRQGATNKKVSTSQTNSFNLSKQ